MKKLSFLSILTLSLISGTVIFWSSCTKLGQNLRFNLPMQTGSVNIVIPASNNTSGTVTYGPVTNTFNVDSFIRASTGNQLGIANIYSVKLASCSITINNATTDNNFANFASCSASFSSNADTNPYSISISNPDQYSTTLTLPVDTTVDLTSYLGDQFYYSVSGSLRRPTTTSLNCTISYGFNIIVKG